ncbi:MAG: dipeptidyl-peptidase 3 family protein, partial [Nannocystaceae bacterium]
MITRTPVAISFLTLSLALACGQPATPTPDKKAPVEEPQPDPLAPKTADSGGFAYRAEQFADNQVLRYQIPGFEELSREKKQLLYYLYEAALSGRDIIFDQKYRHNLAIRHTLEAIWRSYKHERDTPDYKNFVTYTKQVWFARGIHHDYSGSKFVPAFSPEFFAKAVRGSDKTLLPLREGETVDALIERLSPFIFDPKLDPKRVNRAEGVDKVETSAVNFYEGVTEKEVRDFYAKRSKGDGPTPVSHGLNSKLVKQDGKLVEKVWKADGMYGPAIQEIIKWLEKAITVAETPEQKKALELLVAYYRTGDLKTFDDYSIAWVQDTKSATDVVNGFIEVYNDPLGFRATYESVVSFKDQEASKRIAAIGSQAQWFEDHSPI